MSDSGTTTKTVALLGSWRCLECGWSMCADTEEPVISCRNRTCKDFGKQWELPKVEVQLKMEVKGIALSI